MNGTGEITLSASALDVWSKLMDPDILSKCIVGCDALEAVGEGQYHANLSIGIAAVKGRYDASITLTDVEELAGYRLIVHGEGGPGFVDAEGVIRIGTEDAEKTTLAYEYTAKVGGKIAGVGQRMLGGVAKLVMNDFFKRLKKEIEDGAKMA